MPIARKFLTGTTNDLWYIYNQELNGVSNDLKVLNNDLNKQAEDDKNNGNRHDITLSGNDLSGGDITLSVPDDTESYKAALKKFGENATKLWIIWLVHPRTAVVVLRIIWITLKQSLDKAFDQLGQLGDVLQAGSDNTDAHMDELMDQARGIAQTGQRDPR